MAIVFGQLYPQLRIVGLEPQDAPRQLSTRNLAEAGLSDRVEVRDQLIQNLADAAAFDLVWLPQVFLPPAVFAVALERSRVALHPSGWLLLVTLSLPGAGLGPSVARLNNVLIGGSPLLGPRVELAIPCRGAAGGW